ncbi:MAG: DegT/DnrJ/EryC1/StrS family aminotransferase [Candidatus Colwellbacteria bacterium]|nr:DegT/DnrJ/EryC1/StrS family aminotransferase [Candidatus Colwellbacteria bacterium]
MIPVNRPLLISGEGKYLAEAIKTGWISSEGPFVKEFENKFAAYVGKKYGTAVSSGTAALEVAMGAIELKAGDEVIMPTFTIMSCAVAVVAYGGIPVFVDSEPDTWNMDVSQIEKKVTKRTKAIMVVHIYGHPCDMDAIIQIAKRKGLIVIEDTAEAIGAEYKGGYRTVPFKGKKCGTFGDISCFSFYPNKTITTGEGGMLLTNNKKFKERADRLRDLGFIQEKRYYHEEIARNYRMTNIQAALGVAQMKNIKKLIKIKRGYGKLYNKLLANIPGLQLPVEKPYAKNIYWMYGIVLDKSTGFNNETFAKKLALQGIGTRPFFYPLHHQPVWRKSEYRAVKERNKDSFPVADKIAKQGLYLPSGLGNTEEEIRYISATIRKLLKS